MKIRLILSVRFKPEADIYIRIINPKNERFVEHACVPGRYVCVCVCVRESLCVNSFLALLLSDSLVVAGDGNCTVNWPPLDLCDNLWS